MFLFCIQPELFIADKPRNHYRSFRFAKYSTVLLFSAEKTVHYVTLKSLK